MRNCIFFVLLLMLGVSGCQKDTVKVGGDFFSYQTNELDITAEYPIFTSQNAEINQGCMAMNNQIARWMDSLQNDLKEQLKNYLQIAQEMKEELVLPFELDIKDSVFMADTRYISVRFSVYTLTGGANGLTVYYAFNYDLKNKRMLTSEEILNYNKSEEINTQLQKSFRNPDNCFTDVPTLKNMTAVNFNKMNMCFTYDPLVLGAHYCGAAEISVPRMLLKGDLLLK